MHGTHILRELATSNGRLQISEFHHRCGSIRIEHSRGVGYLQAVTYKEKLKTYYFAVIKGLIQEEVEFGFGLLDICQEGTDVVCFKSAREVVLS